MCYKIIQYAEYSCGHQSVTRQQVVRYRLQHVRDPLMTDSLCRSTVAVEAVVSVLRI